MIHPQFHPAVQTPSFLSPKPLWFVISREGILVRFEGDRAHLPDAGELQPGLVPWDAKLYLGRLGDEDCFAISYTGPAPSGFSYCGLRNLYGHLSEPEFAVAGRAVQILEWDRTHRFCGACGSETHPLLGERARSCPVCGLRAYPRLAPAVIVLIQRADSVLLARAANFPSAFYSTLAGFVEPGESLEETVEREIREEVGIEVTRLRYFGSQPWPFPHSLMIGFRADYLRGEIQVDGNEIIDALWFKADALPELPPKLSIARALIDAWLKRADEVTGVRQNAMEDILPFSTNCGLLLLSGAPGHSGSSRSISKIYG